MTRIVAADPIFAVSDMPRAAEHYKRLGFEISYHDDGYAFAERKGLNLHLHLTDSPTPAVGCSTSTSMTPTNSRQSGALRALR